MGAKRKANDMSVDPNTEIKILAQEKPAADEASTSSDLNGDETAAESADVQPEGNVKKKKALKHRSSKYTAVRAKIDKSKKYDAFAAIELVKKLSYSSFAGTITAHIVGKELGMTATYTLPHSTGKTVRVAIADETVLENIAAGKLDFDVLLAEPKFMSKLAKYAPVLGPKGLMPNPKNNTLTPNPEAQKKKLEAGSTTVKTEKKAPLFHIQLGKTTMDTKDLVENLEAILKSMNLKVDRVSVAATMSPGVKVTVVNTAVVG